MARYTLMIVTSGQGGTQRHLPPEPIDAKDDCHARTQAILWAQQLKTTDVGWVQIRVIPPEGPTFNIDLP